MSKIIKPSLAVLFVAAILFSCNQFKTTTDADGSKYQIHSSKTNGKKPKDGSIVTFDLQIKDSNDSTFKNTYKEGQPLSMPLQKGNFKGAFENALYHLSEGDSATVFVSADSLFSRIQRPLPKGVKAGSDLRFIVKISKVMSQEEFGKEQDMKKDKEVGLMAEFAAKNIPNSQKTQSGIIFSVQKAGTGISPSQGDTVVVNYTGKLMNGKIFDSSIGKKPLVFPVGVGMVIQGWEQALLQMKKGEKSTFFIPSALAYGAQGIPGVITPYSPLLFEVELLEVKKHKK